MTHAAIRTGLALLGAATITLFSVTATAAPPAASASVVVSSAQPQVQVLAQGRRTLSSAEFAEMRGEYRLSTGGLLVVGGARHRPAAELNDKGPLALLAVSPDQLVSTDGRLRLEFRTEANGEVAAVTVHVVPGLL